MNARVPGRALLVLVLVLAVTGGAVMNGRPAAAFVAVIPPPVLVPVASAAAPLVAPGALVAGAALLGFYGGTAALQWAFGPRADDRFTSGSPRPDLQGWKATDLPPAGGPTTQGRFNLVYYQQQAAPGRSLTASIRCTIGTGPRYGSYNYPIYQSTGGTPGYGTTESATSPGTWGGGGFSTSSNQCPIDLSTGREGIGEVLFTDGVTGELLLEWRYSSPRPWSTTVTSTCRDSAGVQTTQTQTETVSQTTPGTVLPNIALAACPAGSHVVETKVTGGRVAALGHPAEQLPLVPPRRAWSPEAETNYPACSLNSGGSASCELLPRVGGTSCLSGIDCSGWLQRPSISCTWGAYTVPNGWCSGESSYEPMLATSTTASPAPSPDASTAPSPAASTAPSPAASSAPSPAPSPAQSIVPGSNVDPVPLGQGTVTVTNADGSTTTQTSRVNPDGSTTTTTRTTNADGTARSESTTVTNVPLGGVNPGGQGAGEPGGEGCLSSSWSWDPRSWVFAPVKCVFLWAFKPSPGAMAQWTSRIDGFKQRPPVSLVTGGVVFIGGFVDAFPPMTSTACGGGGNGGPVFRDMSGSIAVDPVDVAGDLVETNTAACAVWWVARVAVWVGGLLLIYHRVLGSVGGKT